jgi:hypothetical protein
LEDTGIVVPGGRNPILNMTVLFSSNQGTVYIYKLPLAAAVFGDGGAAGEAPEQQQGPDANMKIYENNLLAAITFGTTRYNAKGIVSLGHQNDLELQNDIAALYKQFMESGFATMNGNGNGIRFFAGAGRTVGQPRSMPLPLQH